MRIDLDRDELCADLAVLLSAPDVVAGLAVLASDTAFLSDLLWTARRADRSGWAAAVAEQEALAELRDALERRGARRPQTLAGFRQWLPRRLAKASARPHRGVVSRVLEDPAQLESHRRRLAERHRHSPLNLHLTRAFAGEVTALLLYRAVADAAARAPLDDALRAEFHWALESLLAEEGSRPGVLHEHHSLLATPRAALSAESCEALEYLDMLTRADYEFPACAAVARAASTLASCAEGARPEGGRGPDVPRAGSDVLLEPPGVRPANGRPHVREASH